MDSVTVVFFAALLAGFALLKLAGLAVVTGVLETILLYAGILVIFVFALALIWRAVQVLLNR